MAKNPAIPVGNMSSGKIDKTGSYSTPEQTIPGKSPVQPQLRQWASPSYDPYTGRAARVADDAYAHGNRRSQGPSSWKQVPAAGPHTAPNTTKPGSRPGRWKRPDSFSPSDK